MEFIMKLYQWIQGPDAAIYFAALFAMYEALSMIPAIKANGVFQFIKNGIVWLKDNVFKTKV